MDAAAADAAAWPDALDVDDSDLRRSPSSSHIPLRSGTAARHDGPDSSSSQSHRRIPGSPVPDHLAMRFPLSSAAAALPDGERADPDFSLDAWTRALRLLGDDRAWERPGIAAIRSVPAMSRARQVVGMVTSCTPNRIGDLFLSLKDPTGTIGASVHRKVFSTGFLDKGISVGSVIVLKEVAVFRPSRRPRTPCYLNITKENIFTLMLKDFRSPSKKVIPSDPNGSQLPANCIESQRSAFGGDSHMERRAGTEAHGERTTIFSKICRTRDSQIADVFSDNCAADAVQAGMLRMDKDTIHGTQSHQEIWLEGAGTNSPSKSVPSYNTSQRLQKICNSMNPADCQQRKGESSTKHGRGSETSTNDIMKRLLGGERVLPSSKETTIHHGTPDASNSTARMDTDARCSSQKHKEVGLPQLGEEPCSRHISNSKSEEHHQQNLNDPNNPNTICSQPSQCGGSVMSRTGASTQDTAHGKLRQHNGECVLPCNKRLRNDLLPSSRNAMPSMEVETYDLENKVNFELDTADKFHGQQMDFSTPTVGVQLTQENCSLSTSSATTVSASLRSDPKKLAPLASLSQWTDDQLSELFVDY